MVRLRLVTRTAVAGGSTPIQPDEPRRDVTGVARVAGAEAEAEAEGEGEAIAVGRSGMRVVRAGERGVGT